jgi:K+/H+ antiporter YhaU regulatory subunit KhtT
MAFRARFNSTVVLIERGEIQYFAPKRNWVLMPFDKLKILSTDDQIEKLIKEYESSLVSQLQEQSEDNKASFGLHSFTIDKESPLAENKIKDTKIREKIEGIIVGVERNEQRIINPGPDFTLQALDRVWMVGNLKKMENVKILSWILCVFVLLTSSASWATPTAKVDCHFFFGGSEKVISVKDDKNIYETPSEKLGYFFKTRITWANEKKNSIKVYTYAYTEPRVKLIHQA